MPFTAVCPYCRVARFRAPKRKRGTFASCPRCRQDFLLVPESNTAPFVDYKLPPFESADRSDTEEAPAAEAQTDPVTPVPEPLAAVAAEPPPVEPIPPADRPPDHRDVPLRFALVAAGLFGVAVLVSQLPYGRYAGGALAGVGIVLGGLSLLGLDARRWVGWAAVGLNGFALLLVVALPGWLGLSTWAPAANPEAGPKPVTSVGRDGSLPRPADWVDARNAVWEHGDVRVAVTAVTVGPHGDRTARTLRVGLKLTNVGVARAIDFAGWPAAPPGEPALTAGGKSLPVRGSPAADRALVMPGKSAETAVVFAAPAGPPDDLQLELPAAAFGGTDPVRFHIPRTLIRGR